MDEIFGIKNFRNDITRIKCNPKNFNRKAYGNIKDLILFYSKSKNPIWNEVKEKLSEEDINRLFKKQINMVSIILQYHYMLPEKQKTVIQENPGGACFHLQGDIGEATQTLLMI